MRKGRRWGEGRGKGMGREREKARGRKREKGSGRERGRRRGKERKREEKERKTSLRKANQPAQRSGNPCRRDLEDELSSTAYSLRSVHPLDNGSGIQQSRTLVGPLVKGKRTHCPRPR